MQSKKFDIISLGRAAVDVYANELGTRLEDAHTFSKYLGGSSGNIAYGCARQGLKVSMLTRVGDDHMGRFVTETFEKAGVDTSQITRDSERLTGVVFLSVKNKDTLPLLFYRKDCADMGLRAEHIDETHIGSTKVLIITGTHLSQRGTREACLKAIEYAKKQNVKIVVDIDYRPVLWGLTKLDAGENFFVSSDNVSEALQEIFRYCDVIVGTEAEIHIGGGSTDTREALKTIRSHTSATLVMKRGALGCQVFTEAIPDSLESVPLLKGFPVNVLSTVGAGDAFMSGLMRGYLAGKAWEESVRFANACGALVVSRQGCAPAIPTKEELDDYLSRTEPPFNVHLDSRINHLHRVTSRERHWDQVAILAFDHRIPFEEFLSTKLSLKKAEYAPKITELKKLILKAFYATCEKRGLSGKAGILCDDTYGQEVLNDITGRNFLITRPSESSRSRPLEFEKESIGLEMTSWPHEHVVKCLFFIDPDDTPALLETQLQTLKRLYTDCLQSGRELMLEWLPLTPNKKTPETIGNIMQNLYSYGIFPDWWKLLMESQAEWDIATETISKWDPYCRGILLLGAANSMEHMEKLFKLGAKQKLARGFAVGRTIFSAASEEWFRGNFSDAEFVQTISKNYENLISSWGNF